MKKIILILLIISLFTSSVFALELAKYKGYSTANVIVNGNKLVFTDVPPIIMDGRTLIPFRAVAEAVNGIVSWNGTTKTASVEKPQVNIMFFETNDGLTAVGKPAETFPLWSQHDKFLSYVSLGNLKKGQYTLALSLNKTFSETGETKELKSISNINVNVSEDNSPSMIANSWDKAIIDEDNTLYSFVVKMKDTTGKFKSIASFKIFVK